MTGKKDKRLRGAAGREERQGVKHPRKALYRARAHANPLSDSQWPVPACPSEYDWNQHFPEFFNAAQAAANSSVAPATANGQQQQTMPFVARQAADAQCTDPLSALQGNPDPVLSSNLAQPAAQSPEAVHMTDEDAAAAQHAQHTQQGSAQQQHDDAQQAQDQAGTGRHADLQVRFADVGCGFGGLLVRLSPLYPDKLMIGMEIRDKVTNYVIERVSALRREEAGTFTNISALRTNAMRHLPNFFAKGQLHKLFFLFPDPHFKTANHRRRIIQTSLLAEYAYCLAVGGMLYTVTDVPELAEWMRNKLDAHPLFEKPSICCRVNDSELDQDAAANLLTSASEEAQKVARNEGKTFRHVYQRIQDPEEIQS